MNDERDDIESVVNDLAVRVQKLEAQREQILKPKIERLQESNNELVDRLGQLESEKKVLRAELESLGELGADKQSTPKKRVLDLRQLLINKAKADYESNGDGMIAWDYNQVIDGLESNGHGKVWPAQAHDAMEDAGDAEGFGFGTNDQDVKVVRVSWESLPAYTSVNGVNNAEGESPLDQSTASD